MNLRNQKGFTLTEMMIAVAVIVILAAIAVPKYIAVRKAMRDQTVSRYLSGVANGAQTYRRAMGEKRFPASLNKLYRTQPGQTTPLITPPEDMGGAEDNINTIHFYDWSFAWSSDPAADTFSCTATPTDTSNKLRLAVFEDGKVRYTENATTPTRTSPVYKK